MSPLVGPALGGRRMQGANCSGSRTNKVARGARLPAALEQALEHPPGSQQLQTPHRHQLTRSCRNRHQRSRRSSSGSDACRAGCSWAPARWGQTGRGGHSQARGLCCRRLHRPGTLHLWGLGRNQDQ